MNYINAKSVYEKFSLPPLTVRLNIKAPVSSSITFTRNIQRLGLSNVIPTPIDWRTRLSLCPVLSQETCGNCWAISTFSSLADRFMIQKKIRNLEFNPVFAQCINTSLVPRNTSCNGGTPADCVPYLEESGIPADRSKWSEICINRLKCTLPECSSLPKPDVNIIPYKIQKNTTTSSAIVNNGIVDKKNTILHMKGELVNGPYPVCFFMPIDFYVSQLIVTDKYPDGYFWQDTNGIYINGAYNDILETLVNTMDKRSPNSGKKIKNEFGITSPLMWGNILSYGDEVSGHAVEIVGWGVGYTGEKYGNVPYWIGKNSWGVNWGEKGYFKIAMNTEESPLNQNVAFDIPMYYGEEGFGSGTIFHPDLKTGHVEGYVLPNRLQQFGTSLENDTRIIFWLCVLFLVIYLVIRRT